ncbi:MAG: TIGR02452 family protein [Selenomonadaceae bacterium]|nr:TIGR02452 family protein [Selenomonadaceae bacterium]
MYVTKEQLADVFADTEKFYRADKTLQSAIQKSIAGTAYYDAETYPPLPAKKFDATKISVIKSRTFEAAFKLRADFPDARIAVLNFASATNPGGGVVHGSRAQEEALCRCSTLYAALNTDDNWIRYYKFHRDRRDSVYTDACIFTPEIVVFKSDTDIPKTLPSENWIAVDVMTCAAPNLREHPNNIYNPGKMASAKLSDTELLAVHEKRARHMLTVLASHGVEIFVTGAFGCGAFKNNPSVVATAYKNILPEFDGAFREIVFAIYCTPRETQNFDAFKKIL